MKGAKDARLPLITDECSDLPRGGLACLGVSLHSAALASGKLAGRVLLGANPKDLPLEEVAVEEMGISRSERGAAGHHHSCRVLAEPPSVATCHGNRDTTSSAMRSKSR